MQFGHFPQSMDYVVQVLLKHTYHQKKSGKLLAAVHEY